MTEAKERLARWLGIPCLDNLIATDSVSAVRLACTSAGTWRGKALFLYERDGWSVFDDLAGYFSSIPGRSWLEFAKSDQFVFAGYNDAICSGELIVIAGGIVQREFAQDRDNPSANIDVGSLPSEETHPMRSWLDVASFVDMDSLVGADEGHLWVSESPGAR